MVGAVLTGTINVFAVSSSACKRSLREHFKDVVKGACFWCSEGGSFKSELVTYSFNVNSPYLHNSVNRECCLLSPVT